MNNIGNKNIEVVLIVVYSFSVISIIMFPGTLSMLISLAFIIITIAIGYKVAKNGDKTSSTLILVFPIVLSAFQNIYLGMGAWNLSSLTLQILLSLHFLLYTGVVLLSLDTVISKLKWIIISIIVILFQSVLLYVLNPAPIVSVISSMRNIFSCMLIYCFAIVMSNHVDYKSYYKWLRRISWTIALFGLFEWFNGLQIWEKLNIKQLWKLKGIPTNLWGIPPNWYSSEMIGGNQLRRMVSTFADPVNLGTFLFAAFMIAWYKKDWRLTIVLGLCAVLTVSKGSLLGFLIFIIVYVWRTNKYRAFLPLMAGISLLIGLCFIRYSMVSSTGSIIVHTTGLLSAFSVMKNHPFGLGVGNVGVLAGLYNETSVTVGVSETGIGVIIAQLGIVGLVVYVLFFIKLCSIPQKWKNSFQRERVLYYTLMFSFFANVLFNEVALSPNSCCLYFIELAFLNNNLDMPIEYINKKRWFSFTNSSIYNS